MRKHNGIPNERECDDYHDLDLLRFKKSIGILHFTLNEIFGLNKGMRNEISLIGISILYLAASSRVKMSDLVQLRNVAKSTVTNYVDTLEKNEFIRREGRT